MLSRSARHTAALAAILTSATLVHVGYGQYTGARTPTSRLSGFEVGEPLPKLALRPLAGQPAADAPPVAAGVCRLLVFFSVTCEHCHTAARRDAATPDSLRLPTLWVSHTDDPAAASFAAALRGVAPVMYGGPTAFQKMDVLGAPAAFLVMPRGNVRWVGGYVGGAEYHRLVREKC